MMMLRARALASKPNGSSTIERSRPDPLESRKAKTLLSRCLCSWQQKWCWAVALASSLTLMLTAFSVYYQLVGVSWYLQQQDTDTVEEPMKIKLGGWQEQPEFAVQIDKFIQLQQHGELSKRACPCCGWHGDTFAFMNKRTDRKCPQCGAAERHRRLCATLGTGRPRFHDNRNNASSISVSLSSSWWTYSDHSRALVGMPFRLVHFGAQKQMETILSRVRGIDHVALDFMVQSYANSYSEHVLFADVTNIPLPTKFADGIIILHVLEHITDMDQAIQELKRVLHPSGWLLVESPCFDRHGVSKDCRGNMSEHERTKCAGQWDHVWVLDCQDFENRLEQNGFDCYEVNGSNPVDFGRALAIMEECHCNHRSPLFACKHKK